MVFSRRSLSHPRANFGRGVMTATSLFSAFHITNIATLFLSFTPAMNTWVGEYHASFNRVLLSATWVFGYLAAALQLLFTIMLLRCSPSSQTCIPVCSPTMGAVQEICMRVKHAFMEPILGRSLEWEGATQQMSVGWRGRLPGLLPSLIHLPLPCHRWRNREAEALDRVALSHSEA